MIKIIGFIFYYLATAWYYKYDISHPTVLFLLIFTLYSIAAPILVALKVLPYLETYPKSIFLHLVASIAFVFASYTKRIEIKSNAVLCWFIEKRKVGLYLVLIGCSLLSIYYVTQIYLSGFVQKYDRAISTNPAHFLGFSFYMVTTCISLLVVKSVYKKNRWPNYTVAIYTLLFFLSFLVTGERSYLVKYILVLLLIYNFTIKKLNQYEVMIGFFVALFIVYFLGTLKMFFLSNTISFNINYTFIDLIYGEFKSSGRNVALLCQLVPKKMPFSYGESLINDIIRSVIPGFLFPRYEGTTTWFNRIFFANFFNKGGGVGFSLVGVGYLNFGIIGVIGLFSFFGYLARFLYRKSQQSYLVLVIYANYITVLVSTIRYDLGGPISQFWKHVIIVIFIIWIIESPFSTKTASCSLPVAKIRKK